MGERAPTTSGCSWISLAMKWRWLPLSTRKAEAHRLELAARSTGTLPNRRRRCLVVGQHDPVALLEVGQRVGEGRQRQRVRAEIHRAGRLALPVADGERRALARADQQVGLPVEQEGQREGALEPRQADRDGLAGVRPRSSASVTRCATTSVSVSRREDMALAASSSSRSSRKFSMMPLWTTATLACRVRMGVVLGRAPVRRPARVADADRAAQRLVPQHRLEIAQLARRAAPM